ncbi:MAG: hypothetical protein HYR96_12350 [Deltaproteobacteria bacterium]|nr:hypothetical protein [Deltaproteobacteria bacterium]MBI3296011.1 hypothetical protein [Deltaproteobacteria bacterium]
MKYVLWILLALGLVAAGVNAVETDFRAKGAATAHSVDSKKDVRVTITGEAAEAIYWLMAIKNANPPSVPGPKPKPISGEGISCRLSEDSHQRPDTYECVLVIEPTGVRRAGGKP